LQNNVIVGLGSIVSNQFDIENCLVAGCPARVVKENLNWKARVDY
jgi:serine acetyltransferase